ncbi:MAG: agmatinase family protein [Kiritimatiellaeota bacterium]|nr:agmatinase family protein [Kiritimatiellota bacterium]
MHPQTFTPVPCVWYDDGMNVNGAGVRDGSFGGLGVAPERAEVVLIPVPWEATVSDGEGTSEGPEAIRDASPQIEFWDPYRERAWTGVAMLEEDAPGVKHKGHMARKQAQQVITALENGAKAPSTAQVNAACESMVAAVESLCAQWLSRGKVAGVVGGDHSTALGLYRALARRGEAFGILHVDAHCDLREAYEGFRHSHASIMYNAVTEGLAKRLTQVAVRDFCEEEAAFAQRHRTRVRQFTDRELTRRRATGETWETTCAAIVATLPRQVAISLDVDGLTPWLCPHTGTPVPGGIGYEECFYLFEAVCTSGRAIIGFDVTETVPGKPDAAVSARAIYRLATLAHPRNTRPKRHTTP